MSAHQATILTSNHSPTIHQANAGSGGEHTPGFFGRLSSFSVFARERHSIGDAKINPAAPGDKVEQLQNSDQGDKAIAKAIANTNIVVDSDTASPSMEAEKASILNKNNIDNDGVSGYPSLQTWATDKQTEVRTPKTIERTAEAALEEAIDNAADNDSLGWPGQH